MWFQRLSGVIGYIDSEYYIVNNIRLITVVFTTKSKQIDSFTRYVVSKIILA